MVLILSTSPSAPQVLPDQFNLSHYSDGMGLSGFDPNRRLKTPGTTVTHNFGSQINRTATPGSHILDFKVDITYRLEEANENDTHRQKGFDCP